MSELSKLRNARQKGSSEEDHSSNEKSASNKKPILLIIILIFILIVSVVGAFYLGTKMAHKVSGDSQVETEEVTEEDFPGEGRPQKTYYIITPSFAVEIKDSAQQRHYLQVSVGFVLQSKNIAMLLQKHDPLIKDKILELISGKNYSELLTPEGKEKMKLEIMNATKNLLLQRENASGIEGVLFVDYVME